MAGSKLSEPLAETFETEGPKCPYCARQYTADEPHYFDEMNFTEMECYACERTFRVDVYTSTSWTCTAIEAQPHDR